MSTKQMVKNPNLKSGKGEKETITKKPTQKPTKPNAGTTKQDKLDEMDEALKKQIAKKKRSDRNKKIIFTATGLLLAGVTLSVPAIIYDKNREYTISVESRVNGFRSYSLNVKKGATIKDIKEQLVVLDAYNFVGIFKDSALTQEYKDTDKIKADTTIFLKYEIKTFTLTIPQGDDFNIILSQSLDTNKIEWGTEINFRLHLDESVDPTLVHVFVNDEELKPDINGYFQIPFMQQNAIIDVRGVTVRQYVLGEVAKQITIKKDGTPLTKGDTIKWGDELEITYTETSGYHMSQFIVENATSLGENLYKVTGELTITYQESPNEFILGKMSPQIIIKRNGIALSQGDSVFYDEELEITYVVTEGYRMTEFNVEGATSLGDNLYKVTGQLTITYSEEDENLINLIFTNYGDYYSVKAKDTNISGKLVIPSVYDDLPVTEIEENGFNGCENLTSITIPESIEIIGNKAFYNCTGLTEIIYNAAECADLEFGSGVFYGAGQNSTGIEVTFGESVKTIPADLFCGDINELAPKITSVIIGSNVTSIGKEAFCFCINLINVTIGPSVKNIDEGAFYYCTNLTNVIMGENVTTIGYESFSDCYSLTIITIPESVTKIENNAFFKCTNLTKIIFNATACADFESDSKVFSQAGQDATGVAVTIGESVKIIPAYLFYDDINVWYPNIISVTIGSNVTSIGVAAFMGCTTLKDVVVKSKAVYDVISSRVSENGCLVNYIKTGGTVKVSADVDDNSNTYLINNFTRSEELVDGYWVYTKK